MLKTIIFLILTCLFSSLAFAKICSKGIPCGNTCIAAWKNCRVGRGTAVHISEIQYQTNNYSQNLNNLNKHNYIEEKITQNLKDKQCNFRSYGGTFFLCNTKDNKILKCMGRCSSLIGVKKGTTLNFYDNYKIVEFNDNYNNSACNISSCSEVE